MCNVHQFKLITADSASTNAIPVRTSLTRLPFVTKGFVKKGDFGARRRAEQKQEKKLATTKRETPTNWKLPDEETK